jgi:hypothetical protein
VIVRSSIVGDLVASLRRKNPLSAVQSCASRLSLDYTLYSVTVVFWGSAARSRGRRKQRHRVREAKLDQLLALGEQNKEIRLSATARSRVLSTASRACNRDEIRALPHTRARRTAHGLA